MANQNNNQPVNMPGSGPVKHEHKSMMVAFGLIALTIFVVALIILGLSKSDDDKADNNTQSVANNTEQATSNEPDSRLSDVDAASEGFYSTEEGAAQESRDKLTNIATDDSRDDVERKAALDALADQCFLAFDTSCIEDLLPEYEEGDYDQTFPKSLIEDIDSINAEVEGLQNSQPGGEPVDQ